MLSLYFVRIHKSLRMTPARAAGISDELHDMGWIVGLIDARAPAPKKRGPYKKARQGDFKLRHYQQHALLAPHSCRMRPAKIACGGRRPEGEPMKNNDCKVPAWVHGVVADVSSYLMENGQVEVAIALKEALEQGDTARVQIQSRVPITVQCCSCRTPKLAATDVRALNQALH